MVPPRTISSANLVGLTAEVNISYLESPSNFWCTLCKDENVYACLKERMQVYCKDSPFCSQKWKLGDYCCAQSKFDSYWYRALVASEPKDGTCSVFFIDIGSTEYLSVSRLKPLKPEFFEIPRSAVCCKLQSIVPFSSNDWSENAKAVFRNIVKRDLICNFVSKLRSEKFEVILLSKRDGINISTILVQGGHAKLSLEIDDTLPKTIESYVANAYLQHNLTGSTSNITISVYTSPYNFYVQERSRLVALKTLKDQLTDDSLKTRYFALNTITPGTPCLVPFNDGHYYRAVVTDVQDDIVDVFYVDYGSSAIVKKTHCSPILNHQKVDSVYAHKCCLANIEVMNGRDVAERLQEEFFKLNNTCTTCVFHSVKAGVYSVSLYTESKNFAEHLAELKLVRFFGDRRGNGADTIMRSKPIMSPEFEMRHPILSISNPTSIRSFVTPRLNINPGKQEKFYITYINDVNEFYVWLAKVYSQNEEFISSLNMYYRSIKRASIDPAQLVEGSAVVIKHKDGNFHRAKVRDVISNFVEVKLVDQGSRCKIPIKHVYPCDEQFMNLPVQAIACSLDGFDNEVPIEIIQKMEQLCLNRVLTAKILGAKIHHVINVLLYLKEDRFDANSCVNTILEHALQSASVRDRHLYREHENTAKVESSQLSGVKRFRPPLLPTPSTKASVTYGRRDANEAHFGSNYNYHVPKRSDLKHDQGAHHFEQRKRIPYHRNDDNRGDDYRFQKNYPEDAVQIENGGPRDDRNSNRTRNFHDSEDYERYQANKNLNLNYRGRGRGSRRGAVKSSENRIRRREYGHDEGKNFEGRSNQSRREYVDDGKSFDSRGSYNRRDYTNKGDRAPRYNRGDNTLRINNTRNFPTETRAAPNKQYQKYDRNSAQSQRHNRSQVKGNDNTESLSSDNQKVYEHRRASRNEKYRTSVESEEVSLSNRTSDELKDVRAEIICAKHYQKFTVSDKHVEFSICGFVDSAHIEITIKSKEDELRTYLENLKIAASTFPVLTELHVGCPCVVLFSTDGEWYRGIVEEQINTSSALIKFVDFGNKEVISKENIRILPENFARAPFCVTCCLYGVADTQTSKEVCLNGEGLLVDTDEHPKLWTGEIEKYGNTFLLRCSDLISFMERNDLCTLYEACTVPPCVVPNEVEECTLSMVYNPADFFVNLNRQEAQAKEMEAEIQMAVNSDKIPFPLSVGSYCIVKDSDDEWRRAIIYELPENSDHVTAFCCDVGFFEERVQILNLIPFSKKLWSYPRLAYRCMLSGSEYTEDEAELLCEKMEDSLKVKFLSYHAPFLVEIGELGISPKVDDKITYPMLWPGDYVSAITYENSVFLTCFSEPLHKIEFTFDDDSCDVAEDESYVLVQANGWKRAKRLSSDSFLLLDYGIDIANVVYKRMPVYALKMPASTVVITNLDGGLPLQSHVYQVLVKSFHDMTVSLKSVPLSKFSSKVHVTAFAVPNSICFRNVPMQHYYENYVESLIAIDTGTLSKVPHSGDYVKIKDPVARARVLKTDGEFVDIDMIDFGKTKKVRTSSLYELPCSLSKPLSTAVRFEIHDTELELTVNDSTYLLQLLRNCGTEIKFVNDTLLLDGSSVGPYISLLSEILCHKVYVEIFIENRDLITFNGFICAYNSFDDFYVQPFSDNRLINNISKLLSVDYDKPEVHVDLKELCGVFDFDNDFFYRCSVIENVDETDNYLVLLVDNGKVQSFGLDRLFPINTFLKHIPSLALHCGLCEKTKNETITEKCWYKFGMKYDASKSEVYELTYAESVSSCDSTKVLHSNSLIYEDSLCYSDEQPCENDSCKSDEKTCKDCFYKTDEKYYEDDSCKSNERLYEDDSYKFYDEVYEDDSCNSDVKESVASMIDLLDVSAALSSINITADDPADKQRQNLIHQPPDSEEVSPSSFYNTDNPSNRMEHRTLSDENECELH